LDDISLARDGHARRNSEMRASYDTQAASRQPPRNANWARRKTHDHHMTSYLSFTFDAGQRRKLAEHYAEGVSMAKLAGKYECDETTIWQALQDPFAAAA
jgi:hypothetical protein